MGYFWIITSRYAECDNWISIGMEHRHEAPPILRIRLLLAGTFIGYPLQRYEETIAYLKEALKIAQAEDEKALIGQSLMMLSIFCIGLPEEYDRGKNMMHEALILLREAGTNVQLGEAFNVMGELERAMGNYRTANQYYEESLNHILESGVVRRIKLAYQNLGSVALHQGDYSSAENYLRQSITDLTSYDRFAVLSGLSSLAATFAAQNHFDKAARIIGAVESHLDHIGTPLQLPDLQQFERAVKDIQEQLGEDRYQTLWEDGSKMSITEVVNYALGGS
jgi:tetratricopeptide (TPR) repeat protein